MSLETRVARLEARERIKELKSAYCFAVDRQEWDGFHELFTHDVVLDFGTLGEYEGHDGIDRFTAEFVEETLQGSAHFLTNPIIDIDIDDEIATGRWYVESPITFADGTAGWRQGRYDDEYHMVDNKWKIARSNMQFMYAADFDNEDGWSELELL
jgi:hypothetical protein